MEFLMVFTADTEFGHLVISRRKPHTFFSLFHILKCWSIISMFASK